MKSLFETVACQAARRSGDYIKRSVGRTHKISHKGRINIVTDVDKKSEEMIIKDILSAFPDHSILSEEGSPRDRRSPYRWVIDPIDGTTNFAHAFPFFCVSIALEKDGNIIMGVVYDPMRDELFTASLGSGSRLNGRKISVSGTTGLSKSLLSTGFSYGIKGARNTNVRNFSRFLMKAQAIRRPGSAALDLCYVACGRFDGYWELDLHPWDIAAAGLIVSEAGGVITTCKGKKYSHYNKDVLASNGSIHKDMLAVLNTK